MKDKIIILDHNKGGRMANQLWNFISVYAYAKEKNFVCDNYSFFKYSKYFNIPVRNFLVKAILFGPLPQKLKYRLHRRYVRYLKEKYPKKIIHSSDESPTYLPPSSKQDLKIDKKIYLTGWLFRNPVGIAKYRTEIISYFKPKKYIEDTAKSVLSPLRNKYSNIVGVHIRQADYKLVGSGEYYFTASEVKKMLADYVEQINQRIGDTVFVICSDGDIKYEDFKGLNVHICTGNEAEDLFTLAKTDRIIGSNSTYGAFAAYYGNIPIYCINRDKIDWKKFEETKLFDYYNNCTMVQQ